MTKKFIILLSITMFADLCSAIPPPSHVVAVGGHKQSFLYWTPVESAVNYKIFRSVYSTHGFTHIATSTSNNYTDQNLANEKTYYYYIISYDGQDTSLPSQTAKSVTVSQGMLCYFQFSDFTFYFSPWISGTDGTTLLSAQEAYLNQNSSAPDYTFNLSMALQITRDRKYLFFTESGSIKMLNFKDRRVKIIVPDQVETLSGLSLSRGNKKIVYVKKYLGKLSIYLNDTDGNNEELLLSNSNNNAYPDFSPDGTKAVFVSTSISGDSELYEINLASKTTTRLTTNSLNEEYPRYSPDGTKICFQAFDSASNSYDIYTIQSNGSGLTGITGSSTANEYFPAWAPDGSKIAYLLRTDYTNDSGTQYYFHITAKNADGTGNVSYLSNQNSKVIRSGLIWTGKTDVISPGRIYDLSVSAISHDSVTLNFTAPGDDCFTGQCTGYTIMYSKSPIDDESEATLREIDIQPSSAGSTESIVLNRLECRTQYYIAVVARDEEFNKSEISNIVSASTDDYEDTSAPQPPSNLTATPKNNLRIKLSWNHSPSNDTAGYIITRNSSEIARILYTDNFEDTVASLSAYIYDVKAYDCKSNLSSSVISSPAISKDTMYPSAPRWIRVYNLEQGVKLKWEKVELPDIGGYKVYRKYNGSTQLIATVTENSYTDNSGITGREYIYYIKTTDRAGNESGSSDNVSGTKGFTDNQRILVIINSASSDSIEIGEYYALKRNIAPQNILYLNMPLSYSISISDYLSTIHNPVKSFIQDNMLSDKILYLVTTKGVPVSVSGRCVDDMLADIYNATADYMPAIEDIYNYPHPYYGSKKRFTPQYSMLCVSRLDGPTSELVKSIIDKALYAEKHSYILNNGTMWLDDRNLNFNLYDSFYSFAERFIQTPAIVAKTNGINAQTDGTSSLFAINSCSDTLYYYGWYSYWNFKEVFNGYLKVGSIAGHLDSASFYSANNTGDNNWGIHLLSRGATAVYGAIIEPYTVTFPNGGIFYDRFFKGFNLAESYWSSTNTMRWRMMLIGDPLYNPYAHDPVQDTQPPVISNIQTCAGGLRTFFIKWDTDEITEHAVQYYTGSETPVDTGYKQWFSKNAQIVIDNLEKNQPYYFRVKSKDPSGNETVSDYSVFVYEDSDDDELEDMWEIEYFGSISALNTGDDDNDGFCNLREFELGYNPLVKEKITLASSTATTITWNSQKDRIYKLYYTNNISQTETQFIQAGPYRLGTGTQLKWTDDGINTGQNPQNPAVLKRFYRLTSTPISR